MGKIFSDSFEENLGDYLYEKLAPRVLNLVKIADIINKLEELIKISEASKLTGIPVSYFKTLYRDYKMGVKLGTAENSPIYIHKFELMDVLGRHKLSDQQVMRAIRNIEEKLNRANRLISSTKVSMN